MCCCFCLAYSAFCKEGRKVKRYFRAVISDSRLTLWHSLHNSTSGLRRDGVLDVPFSVSCICYLVKLLPLKFAGVNHGDRCVLLHVQREGAASTGLQTVLHTQGSTEDQSMAGDQAGEPEGGGVLTQCTLHSL